MPVHSTYPEKYERLLVVENLLSVRRKVCLQCLKQFPALLQEEAEESEELVDSGTIVKVGDGNDTMIVNTATSVQSQDTMIVNSEAGTLLESDLGTMVINSDDDEDATMKSKLSTCVLLLVTLYKILIILVFMSPDGVP